MDRKRVEKLQTRFDINIMKRNIDDDIRENALERYEAFARELEEFLSANDNPLVRQKVSEVHLMLAEKYLAPNKPLGAAEPAEREAALTHGRRAVELMEPAAERIQAPQMWGQVGSGWLVIARVKQAEGEYPEAIDAAQKVIRAEKRALAGVGGYEEHYADDLLRSYQIITECAGMLPGEEMRTLGRAVSLRGEKLRRYIRLRALREREPFLEQSFREMGCAIAQREDTVDLAPAEQCFRSAIAVGQRNSAPGYQ